MKKILIVSIIFIFIAACKTSRDQQDFNILFILVDDLGVKDLSNEGSGYYESPNIDRIAGEGMKFTRGYASCQVCSPSRASILTGKYPTKHGITTWIGDRSGEDWRKHNRFDSHLPAEYKRRLGAEEITLAEVLQDNGYQTFFAGKWHLGDKGSWPEDHGFMINKGGYHAGGPFSGGYFSPYDNPNLEDGPDGESLTLRLGRETAAFIEENHDKPFLAYLSFYAVHSPIQTTSQLWEKYREKAARQGLAEKRFIFDRRLPVRQVQDCPVYAGMIEAVDSAVGLVLKTLDEHELMDNTIICFTSDNGGVSSGDAFSTSNLPLRGGKGRQWEGGIREPFYIYVPGVTSAGSFSDIPVSGIDWYPTLLELTGISIPEEQVVDGVSFVSVLEGGKLDERPLFWHFPHYGNQGGEPSSIIMEDEWKLIYYHEDESYELYNIDEDIGEEDNIIDANPELAEAMKNRLQEWLASTNAKFPRKDPLFDPEKRDSLWEYRRTEGIKRLEEKHANYLDANYQPNEDWWGSALSETED